MGLNLEKLISLQEQQVREPVKNVPAKIRKPRHVQRVTRDTAQSCPHVGSIVDRLSHAKQSLSNKTVRAQFFSDVEKTATDSYAIQIGNSIFRMYKDAPETSSYYRGYNGLPVLPTTNKMLYWFGEGLREREERAQQIQEPTDDSP